MKYRMGAELKEWRQKLRRLPVLGSVYAIIAALGLVVLIVGVIGVAAVYTTNKHVRELEEVANRAFFAEHANSLIYAVVMDSRGIYMSADAADRASYGAGVMKFLAELDANMTAWKQYVAPDDRNDFARAQARAQEFIRFRTELVRLGNEVGQGAAREWGDNDANRTNREALNREIDLLAKANYAELARLRAWINEYSIWQFMLAAATMAGGILLAVLLIVLTFGRYREWGPLSAREVHAVPGRYAGTVMSDHRVIFYLTPAVPTDCACAGVPGAALDVGEDSTPARAAAS